MISKSIPVVLNVITRLFQNLVIFIFLARFLETERFAFLTLVFTLIFMISNILDYGLRLRINVDFKDILKNKDRFISDWLALKFLGLIIFIFLISAYGSFASYSFKEIYFFIGAAFSGFLLSISLYFSYFMSANEKYIPELSINAWFLFGCIMSATFLFLTDSDYIFLLIIIFTNFIGAALGFLSFNRNFTSFNLKIWPLKPYSMINELKISSPYFLHLFFTIFIGYFDIILMEVLSSRTYLAEYQIVTRVIIGLSLPIVVTSILFPPRLRKSGSPKVTSIYFQIFLVTSLIIIGALYLLFDSEIISLIFGIKYSYLNQYSILISAILVLKYLQIIPGTLVTFYVSQKSRAKSIFFSAITMVLGFFILVPKYGVSGALYALIISNSVLLVFYAWLSAKANIHSLNLKA